MSTFFNHTIHAIPTGIMTDIDVLLAYVEAYNKQDEDLRVADAAARVEKYLKTYRDLETEQDAKESIVDALTPAQEDKLKEAHAEDYHGTDDNMPDAYESWLENLTSTELMEILATAPSEKGYKEVEPGVFLKTI